MKKLITLILVMVALSIPSFAQLPAISGPFFCCVGSSVVENDSPSVGGIWTSSSTSIATIGSLSGILTGVAPGTTTITYTSGGSYVTATVTVAAPPAAITGGTSPLCPGASTTLSDATSGGTWVSYDPYSATVGSATGVVTAVSGGYATIEYSLGSGCSATTVVSVTVVPSMAITGGPSTGSICSGAADTLLDSAGIGTSIVWYSNNPAVATVSSTGIVTGVSSGSASIYLTGTTSCGSYTYYDTTWYNITIYGSTVPGTIYGSTSIPIGTTATLVDYGASSPAYSWVSGSPSVASIDISSGVVTGLSLGAAVITYNDTGCSGLAYTTTTVNVVSLNGISGNVIFSGGYYGQLTVYLITYDPTTAILALYDSANYYDYGSDSVYYQFTGLPTDSFRVKAAIDSPGIYTTGFIPTYHTSYFYWHDADVIYFTSGSSDINENINMSYGTTTSGPGFIGGSVYAGADRGTSTGIPVVGLRMCIVNSATNQLMGAATTNTSGSYSFSNLPVGETYYVFPDSLNYLTVPYTSVTLTSSSSSMTVADFEQHTISKTITPLVTGIQNTTPVTASIMAYPNPTTGNLRIQWYETANENATISIADVTGREVYKNTMKMAQGAGNTQLDLSNFTDGLYILTIKSGNINYTNKIQLEH